MAKEIKKKDVLPIPIAGDGTIPNDVYSLEQERQEQEKQEQEPIISTQPVEISDQERVPYSEFGGLSQALEVRKQRAAQRKEEALRDWNKALEEQQSARVALVNAARPGIPALNNANCGIWPTDRLSESFSDPCLGVYTAWEVRRGEVMWRRCLGCMPAR